MAARLSIVQLPPQRRHRKHYATRQAARADIFDYIERFYDPTRRHSTLGMVCPTFNQSMSNYWVHPSAFVDDGAIIGDGTKVWHFCHVMPGAVIGERCSLGQNVVVMNGTRIGNNVKIQNNVSIYEGVVLEDDVFNSRVQ